MVVAQCLEEDLEDSIAKLFCLYLIYVLKNQKKKVSTLYEHVVALSLRSWRLG